MTERTSVLLGLLAYALGAFSCTDCPLAARMAPTVTQETLLALKIGMPEAKVRELLGSPIAGGKTSTPLRPHRWYYALPACLARGGWMVEVQILDDRLFGASAAEGGQEAFRCFSGDCQPIVNPVLFARLPVSRDPPAKRPTADKERSTPIPRRPIGAHADCDDVAQTAD